MQVERRILAVPQLDHARDAHEIHACPEIEAADDRRSRQDQDGEIAPGLDEGMGDGAASAQMAEPETVLDVGPDTVGAGRAGHAISPVGSRRGWAGLVTTANRAARRPGEG